MKPKNRKQRYDEIVSATDKNLNACVIELAESYLKNFPNSQGVWDMYGLALYKTDRLKAAKKALQKAIELLDDTNKAERLSWLFCRMGHIYESSGNLRIALEWHEKAHLANPKEATFLIFQGRVFLRKERFDEASKIFQKATKCKEGCIDEAFYNLGVTYLIQRNYRKAKLYFQKAKKIDPKYKEAKQQLKDVNNLLKIRKNL